jgi:hypothetical protein
MTRAIEKLALVAMPPHLSPHRVALAGGWTVWRDVELRSAGFPAAWIDGLADERLARSVDEAALAGAGGGAPGDAIDGAPGDTIDEALARAQRDASRRLRELASDPRFREAVTWQNRRALHGSIGSLLRRPDGSASSKARRDELLVASYAQRYCCKNERAGFFGASTPARLVEHGPAVTVRPGAGLIAGRATYLEPWAIEALADRLGADPELRPELRPRRMPTVRLDGATLIHSAGRRSELPAAYVRLVEACDGRTPARRIVEQLADPLGLGPAELYDMLADLADERVVVWALEVPTTGGPPERLLRGELEQLAPSPARARALAALDELEAARDRVSGVVGAPGPGAVDALDAALDELERTFVALTGQDSVRNHGEAYAGRTIAGEDCVRDVEVALGPAVIDRLSGPLELVLHSARWFTHEIARRYRAAIGALYRELRGDGPPAVDYPRLHARLPELFPGRAPGSIVAEVGAELQARWRAVLDISGEERRVERSAAALRPAVLRAFAAPRPGWPAARHHSPDVLIAGDGVAAINRGEFLAVLGEIHAGMNSLLVPAVPNAHGDPDAPFALRDLDIDGPCVAPVWSRRRSRIDYYSRSPRDFDLEHAVARSWRPRSQVLALADLVIEPAGQGDAERLVVRTRDGRVAFDAIAFLEHHLVAASFSELELLGGGHRPRVTVDGVVLARERWVVAAADLAFAHAPGAAARFVEARRWARSLGLPRRLFLKVPEETKPLFLDLASPTFVELAARMVRRAQTVAIAEMLPDLDALWLHDAEGRRYTSELRLVAIDPEPWAP